VNLQPRLLGVLGLAVLWAVLWGSIGFALAIAVGLVDPRQIDAGEGPADIAPILGAAGGASGLVFGLLLLVERRRTVAEVRLTRALMWGAVGAAVAAVLMRGQVHEGLVINHMVLGGLAGPVSVGLARLARRRAAATT